MPSDDERFAELEAELGRLQERLQGLEIRGEYLATREDLEKAKSEVNNRIIGLSFGFATLLLGGLALVAAILR